MRYTLLDLTQKILSSMESDEVNSISDTIESLAVVDIIQTTYYDIKARAGFTRDYTVFQLSPSLDVTKPVTMTLPSDVEDVQWVKYNWATVENPEPTFNDVRPLPLHDFLGMVMALNTTEPDVISYTQAVNGQTLTFLAKNTQSPRYFTSIDDNTFLFDSYDADVDNTLQASKTMCYGQKSFAWTPADSFVPDLDEKQHQLLFNEAKSMCFAELKQSAHPKADQNARKLWINQQSAKTKIPLQTAHMRGPYYGRK